ncbi:ATP-binding protein [Algibacter miyuki]|uniref:histidine kinase n=1 Tax=Algibacter miyuki TaxID=1306933 RepID=A0ABV5GUT0_9FLAO|nr:HAMP domain-containing sensor histidine kinase [Algibacter miyuki]MDN3664715.1 HAMP domain-containing sensor histidine kinase [Algibacter miyuki]
MTTLQTSAEQFVIHYLKLYSKRNLAIKEVWAEHFSGLDGISTTLYNYKSWLLAIDKDFKQVPEPFNIKIQDMESAKIAPNIYRVTTVAHWDIPLLHGVFDYGDIRSLFIIEKHNESFKISHLSHSISLIFPKPNEVFPFDPYQREKLKIENKIKSRSQQLEALNKQLSSNLEKLETSNKDLSLFTQVAAHDLKSPLISTITLNRKITDKYENILESKDKKLLELCNRKLENLTQIIDNTLNFHTNSKSLEVNKAEDFNLGELISNIAEELDLETTKKLTVTHTNLPVIRANKDLFFQIFANIIRNSVRYSKQDSDAYVDVSAKKIDNNGYQFCISDNGIGIPEDSRKSVFDLYFKSLNTNPSGTGIGLAICKKIVSFYNGKIWATSNAKNGTSIYFTFFEQ